MMGGSFSSSGGSAIIDTRGPATDTWGAIEAVRAASRTSKFHIGPPTSTTDVTPLAIHTLKVAGSRALLRANSVAYGTSAVRFRPSGRVYGFPDWKKCTCPS